MKGNPVKTTLKIAAVAALAGLTLSACGTPSSSTGSSDGAAGGKSYSIGVVQIITHEALDASREGFKAALADAGLKVTYDEQNANGDQSVAASIAGSFATAKHDLILAIATPTAQAMAQAVTETPVLFTAVTDPVGAKLVASLEAPGANVTGTSDANPVKEQLELIKKVVPKAKTIGVVYNSGEANSVTQVAWVKAAAKPLGLEVKEASATTTAEVQQAADSLNVDAIYVPTDNTVVSAIGSVVQIGESKKIPVFGAEGNTVTGGAIATYGISYRELGYQTGKQAVRILTEGAKPASMPVETQKELALYLNLGAATRMGVTLPADLVAQAKPENITK